MQKMSRPNATIPNPSMLTTIHVFFPDDIERSPTLFSVANSQQEFQALLITKGGGLRGEAGSEKQTQEFVTLQRKERCV
jgi:hypothetical protein